MAGKVILVDVDFKSVHYEVASLLFMLDRINQNGVLGRFGLSIKVIKNWFY